MPKDMSRENIDSMSNECDELNRAEPYIDPKPKPQPKRDLEAPLIRNHSLVAILYFGSLLQVRKVTTCHMT